MYPILALFTFYDPSFPRPLRLIQLTTRIIGYMGISAIFYNTTDKLRSPNEAIFVGIISSVGMLIISIILGRVFLVDFSMHKTETNMSAEVEKKMDEQLDMQSVLPHFFTMQEYYSIIIERKKEFAGSLAPCEDKCGFYKRLIGVLLALAFDTFFIVFFLFFSIKFSPELINSWKLSFIYSLALDVVGSQFVKVFATVTTVSVLQRAFRTKNSHDICANIMWFTGLQYY